MRRALHGLRTAVALTFALVAPAVAQDQRAIETTRELAESAPKDMRIDPADTLVEAQVRAIASELRCPVCQGLSLQDSPTELAQQIRGVIREQLRAGSTSAEVKAFFVSKYGEWILMAPEPTGFNLVVYILPFLGLLAGASFIWWYVRRLSGGGPPESPPVAAEVEEELPV